MHIEGLRSPYDQVGGLVFFGRMLDKARLHAAGKLPSDYGRGGGLDSRVCTFLHLDYERIAEKALAEPDEARVLEWCYEQGRRPTDEEILIFNAFMTKRELARRTVGRYPHAKDRAGAGRPGRHPDLLRYPRRGRGAEVEDARASERQRIEKWRNASSFP